MHRKIRNIVFVTSHTLALVGGLIAFNISRPRYVGLYLVMLLALLLADVMIMRKDSDNHLLSGVGFGLLYDYRIVTSVVMISFSTVVLLGPNLIFYIFSSLTILLLIVAAVKVKPYTLPLAMSIGATTIIGQVFSVEFFAPRADTVWHTAFIQQVAEYGTPRVIETGDYAQYLQAFHVYGGMGVEITGLSPRAFIGLFFALIFPLSSIFIYLTWEEWLTSQIGLIVVVLTISNPQFILWGSKVHPQSMAFVLFLCVLYLLVPPVKSDRRWSLLIFVVGIAWIKTHHLGVAMGLFLLAPIMIIAVKDQYVRTENINNALHSSGLIYYLSLVGGVIVYWSLVTDLYMVPYNWLFGYSPAAQGKQTHLLIKSYDSSVELLYNSIPFFLDFAVTGVLLSLTLYAGYLIWTLDFKIQTQLLIIVIVSTVTGGLFYFPNPAWIPLLSFGLLLRWAIMVIPFVLIMPAIAIKTEIDRNLSPSFTFILFSLLLLSIGTGISDPSIIDIAGYDTDPKRGITNDQVASISFLQDKASNTNIYSPTFMVTYLESFETTNNQNVTMNRTAISGVPGQVVQKNGLSVYPWASGDFPIKVNLDNNGFRKSTTVTQKDVSWDPTGSLIYSNGQTQIYSN